MASGRHAFAILALLLAAPLAARADVTIGSDTTTSTVPLLTASKVARTQVIYMASELGDAYRLNGLSLNLTRMPAVALNNLTIRLKHTSKASFATAEWESSGWVVVYQRTRTIGTTGWISFTFATPFDYNGTDNVMLDISFDNRSATTGTSALCTYSTSAETRMMFANGNSFDGPLTWSSSTPTPTVRTQYLNVKFQTTATAEPTFAPDAGTYSGFQHVTISCSTPGAVIHYTIDGDDPTLEDAALSSGQSVLVDRSITLKAQAWAPLFTPSTIKSAAYVITPVATPTFAPDGGNYTSARNVTINCTTAGVTIHYTTNGAEPTETDPTIISGATLLIDHSLTLKAKAWKQDSPPSEVKSATYVLMATMPVFSPDAGTYASFQQVVVTCATTGAVIHYTTDGNDPTEDSLTVASGDSVSVDHDLTLKARAWAAPFEPSAIKSAGYVFSPVASPTFSPDGGTFTTPQSVTVSCATAGATIHYTLDGNDPTDNDATVDSGTTIAIDRSLTLKARAWKTGSPPSGITSADYVLAATAPEFAPDAGTYAGAQQVVITCTNPNGTIHYTTNGADPTEGDPTIDSGDTVLVEQSLTLKARAWAPPYAPSATKSATYVITPLATPSFTPDGGTYAGPQSIVVTCTTPDVTIHYTKDGSDPTETGDAINSGEAVQVDRPLTLKARAYKQHCVASAIKSASYLLSVATPTLAPDAGTYTSFQDVTVTCETPNAVMHYTTDGADPTQDDPVVTSGASVRVDRALTLKVKAWLSPYAPSAIKSASYTISPLATPTFSPDGGSFTATKSVTVNCTSPGAIIHYTTNGADPTEADLSVASEGAVLVDRSLTLKARAYKNDAIASGVKSASFVLTVTTPAFSPDAGTYATIQHVIVTCSTPSAVIHYTTNGAAPTENDQPVDSGASVLVDASMTLKARAWVPSWSASAVKSAAYVITPVAAPTFNPVGGNYTVSKSVVISCATSGAVIHYTTDGRDPTLEDPRFIPGTPVVVDRSLTLKAKAWKDDCAPSTIQSATYVLTAPAPTFSPDAGTYNKAQTVTITCADANAVVHYTMNGADPTENDDTIESGGTVSVDQPTTLKARAFKTGWTNSPIKTAAYAFTAATPKFEPGANTYDTPQDVAITCDSPNVIIRYTLDGTDPTTTATEYQAGQPIHVDHNLTLQARAWHEGWAVSAIKSASYSFTTATPSFSPDGGSCAGPQNVVVRCATPDCEIHYTTDGTTPTKANSIVEAGSTVMVDHPLTLKAKAWRGDWPASAVKSAAFTFTVATPTFTPDGGADIGPQIVTIACATEGAQIRYTTDGSAPTTSSTLIASGSTVTINQSLTLKARAWKDGYGDSVIKSSVYTIGKALYVKPAGNDGYDGRSWATAKRTVAAAINAASADDQVWVAGDASTPYLERITLKSGVALYGGFAGTETTLSQRNVATNTTILDGSNAGSIVTMTSGTAATRLDGFTLRNGKDGAIQCVYGAPTITNNTITSSSADRGGGIYCSYSSATIINNVIRNNTAASYGGGIYCFSDPSYNPVIANNIIVNNTATTYGGGVYCCYPANVRNNTIVNNSAAQGGGIYSPSNPTLYNNIVVFNSSGINATSSTTLRNNCVYNPSSYNYSGGASSGTGDISVDPHFRDRVDENYHLSPLSACINAGYDNAVPSGSVDIDGDNRIRGTHVDIGADEANPSVTTRTVYVSASGSDGNTGLAWHLAKRSITAAIGIASYGDQIWVASNAASPYVERITLKDGVAIYGGFVGYETELVHRNAVWNETILDGNAAGSVVTVPALLDAQARLDGFTIRNGRAELGGGIYCAGTSTATLATNVITGNVATASGGGIYCSIASPLVTACRIVGNSANSGGGACCASGASPKFNRSTIESNSATTDGGGIACQSANPTLVNNIITGNSAGGDGAGIYCSAAGPNLWNNLVNENVALGNAGGIACRNGSSASIANNTITANTASLDGGGVYCDSSLPVIANNIIAFNSSGLYQSWGPPSLSNNCVYNPDGYDYFGTIPGLGDIQLDPKMDRAHGTFHLTEGSPCIDAGLDAVVGTDWFDCDADARIYGTHVDIGFDEAQGTGWTVPIVHVSLDGSDYNTGDSWQHAKSSIHAGIELALSNGGEVWVAAGTYWELPWLRSYTYVYGGFAGTETARNQRDWRTNETILDAYEYDSAVQISGKCGTLDGFTIRNGLAAQGGAVRCSNASEYAIRNNTITANVATQAGGAIYCDNSTVTICNNLVFANSAPLGAAIHCVQSSPAITNNTIVDNGDSTTDGNIYWDASSPAIANNIVAFNSAGLKQVGESTAVLHHNNVYANTQYDYEGIAAGTNDISADPLLIDRNGRNLHLAVESPCFNAGWNTAIGLPDTDADSLPRIIGRVVDIGAFELAVCPADLDRDGDVDDEDLLEFEQCGSGPLIAPATGCELCDFDLDGDVDTIDFALFQRCRSDSSSSMNVTCMD